MKLAIIGSGPLALFCAQHFDELGAEVVVFQRSPLGGSLRFMLEHGPEMQVAYKQESLSVKSLWQNHLVSVIESLEKKNLTKAGEVLRVHKRFLSKSESISKHTRLHDLFRVIYSVNPKEAILKQLEENPEMFKQLGEKVVNSLHLPVESFQDFDIVIEARGQGLAPKGMGPSESSALNENNIRGSAPIYYEKDIFSKFSSIDKSQLIVVGNTTSAILALVKLKDWLFSKPEHSLSWITPTYSSYKSENDWLNNQLADLLSFAKAHFDEAKKEFEEKIRAWRDLEDYVKVKIPQPIEPMAKLRVYQGYNVTSVDRLLDRDELFATIESPEFREFAPANDLKTIPAQAILVGCGVETDESFARGISSDEPGYYRLNATDLDQGLEQIRNIEQKILAFFSRVE